MRTRPLFLILSLFVLSGGLLPVPAQESLQPTSSQEKTGHLLQIGEVVTCSSVRAYGDYTAKRQLLPGERFRLYAEVLGASHEGRIELDLEYSVYAPDGSKVTGLTHKVSRESAAPNSAAWLPLTLPPDASPGVYSARVEFHDRLGGQSASKSIKFTVLTPNPMELGFTKLRDADYQEALKIFKKASRGDGKESVKLHWGLARAYWGLGAYKNTLKECDKVLKLTEDVEMRAQAHNLKGTSLAEQAKKGDIKKLQQAEKDLRAAFSLAPNTPGVHFNLGYTLLRQGRDEEGTQELERYVELSPDGENVDRARRYIQNPRRARENFSPAFSFVSTDGEYIDLEELQGKVVLIDFWEPWCKPCIAALPSLRRLHRRFDDDGVVVLSVCSDSDRDSLEAFLQGHKAFWPHYLDEKREMRRMFDVRSFPTYFVIDGEGIIRQRVQGWRQRTLSILNGEIKKALKELAKAR